MRQWLTTFVVLSTAVPVWAGPTVVVTSEPDARLRAAIAHAGFETRRFDGKFPDEAQVFLLATPIKGQQRPAALAAAKQVLQEGKTLIISLGSDADAATDLDALLPVNTWTLSKANGGTLRSDTRIVPAAGVALQGELHLSHRYDLHLPYAPIEAGSHRYRPAEMGKSLLNTDWRVLLACDQEGQLPLLIAGRVGPGTAMIFAGDLCDPQLTAQPGYEQLASLLLKDAATESIHPSSDLSSLKLTIPRWQPQGLHLQVANLTDRPCQMLLAYKIYNSAGALLNSVTKPVQVPASQTVTVPLQERSPDLGSDAVVPMDDRDAPYRRIEAGVASPDRRSLYATASSLVDTAPQVTMSIAGPELSQLSPDDRIGAQDALAFPVAGGARIYRYIFPTDEHPKIQVVIRNARHNVAPLAQGKDVDWPENPTVQGLNDLAYSSGSTRGQYPLYGIWAGRSAARQQIALQWAQPVWVAGQDLVAQVNDPGRDRGQPRHYSVAITSADGTHKLPPVKADYPLGRQHDELPPTLTSQLRLTVNDLNPGVTCIPNALRDFGDPAGKTNALVYEWEVQGWLDPQRPPAVAGRLLVTTTDILTGQQTTVCDEQMQLAAFSELSRTVALPTRQSFGPVRIDTQFTPAVGTSVTGEQDVLFIPANSPAIRSKKELGEKDMGLLCSPGFVAFDELGLGTQNNTQGWGGPDDKVWALAHDFMEIGPRNRDAADRLFTTATRFSHYTNPHYDFPSSQPFWDFAGDKLVEMVQNGRFKGIRSLHLGFSDRWNGVPIGSSFNWAHFIAFDNYLRSTGAPGLKGRSRGQIAQEITTRYADQWQKWALNRYAQQMLDLQAKLKNHGVDLTVETHGSFPLAGGELGAKVAKTHKGVGTDVFWELGHEDLLETLGMRFGLIAANPDLESGAYNQWGWVSAILGNPVWFADAGADEPSRRQWYATYFMSRINSQGQFLPLHTYGYSSQGQVGPKQSQANFQNYARTADLITRLRPDQPAGIGMVVSWTGQEKLMGPESGRMGFGLYVGRGHSNVDELTRDLYPRLTKHGVPISFVTSTYALQKWNGTNPLIFVGEAALDPWEIQTLDRLSAAGTPLIVVGDVGAEAAFQSLFGIRRTNAGCIVQGAQAIELADHTWIYRMGSEEQRAARLFCPMAPGNLTGNASTQFAQSILALLNSPLSMPPGLSATPFVSNNQLFLPVIDLGDVHRVAEISVRPEFFRPGLTGPELRVIDMDHTCAIPCRWSDGQLTFSLPIPASSGRLLMITREVTR